MMNREELIKFCRYYKGEEECPYKEEPKRLMWVWEQKWVELSEQEYTTLLGECLDKYVRDGLRTFQQTDDTPVSLKALLYNRYDHWYQDDKFKQWYKERYLSL